MGRYGFFTLSSALSTPLSFPPPLRPLSFSPTTLSPALFLCRRKPSPADDRSSLCLWQPYVTELDLRHSLIPDGIIEDLLHSMPPHRGPDALEDREVPKFDYVGFMEKITRGQEEGGEEAGRKRCNGAY